VKTLKEVGVREPSVTYSESGECYLFVTGISDSMRTRVLVYVLSFGVYYGEGFSEGYARRSGFGDGRRF